MGCANPLAWKPAFAALLADPEALEADADAAVVADSDVVTSATSPSTTAEQPTALSDRMENFGACRGSGELERTPRRMTPAFDQ